MWRKVLTALALIAAAGCSIEEQKAPNLTGPSSLALAITASANPSLLVLDGSSHAVITVQATGPTGQPVSVLLDLSASPSGWGELTQAQITTGADGRASFGFVAGTTPADTTGVPQAITIQLTPSGTHSGEVSRAIAIRVTPEGGANSAPTASFTFVPSAPEVGTAVSFDASASTDEGTACGSNCTYAWDFGDGTTGTGQTTTHTFSIANTVAVKLTVTDARGAATTSTQNVTVAATRLPVVAFTFLPASPEINATVTFDGSTSTYNSLPCGANCSFAWDFGDGTTGTGKTATHAYSTAKSYVVKLTVTESHGGSNVLTKTVTVAATAPTASFTTNPGSPGILQDVTFNASASSAAAGRTISTYQWQFGDGSTATGVTATHQYSVAGTYTVVLTVTDSLGIQGSTTKALTVDVGVTASFTISPTDPTTGQTVYLNAEASQGSAGFGGRNPIVEYIWNFGNSEGTTTTTSPITSTSYSSANTFTINLTVVDSVGRRGTTSKTIIVSN